MAKAPTKAAETSTLVDDAAYDLAFTRVVEAPGMVYRPGEPARMTGAAIKALAGRVGLDVEALGIATPVADA